MSNIVVKDGLSVDKYFNTSGAGDAASPFLSIPADFYLEVSKGSVPKHSIVNKFGRNGAVGTSLAFISISGQYQSPIAATSLEILSGSTADGSAGAGARKVKVVGLDASWNEVTVEVTMNGTTAVALGTQFIRVYRMYVSESGAYATILAPSHLGRITLRTAGGGATWCIIDTIEGTATGFGIGQTQVAGYTIPNGYTGYLLSKTVTVESAKPASIYFFKRENADDVTTPFTGAMRLFEQNDGIAQPFNVGLKSPLQVFPAKTDVGFFAKVGTGTASVSTEFQLLLVQD